MKAKLIELLTGGDIAKAYSLGLNNKTTEELIVLLSKVPFSNTPIGRFCFEMFGEREKALKSLKAGDIKSAIVHLEYMEVILADSLGNLTAFSRK